MFEWRNGPGDPFNVPVLRTRSTYPFYVLVLRDELGELLLQLGYQSQPVEDPGPGWSDLHYVHPDSRTAVFVRDLVDRGPRIVDSLSLVRNMDASGNALCVPGNHDAKLFRKLSGKNVQVTHGLADSLALRKFALGIESLERFVRRESLRRVTECVFGVLALESEPVDPRLYSLVTMEFD